MQYKDFDSWNFKKKNIDIKSSNNLFFKEREIWWCSLGLNVGFEENGKGDEYGRPVLILRKFSKDVCWIIPLSTTKKVGIFYFHFNFIEEIGSTALLTHIRLCDAKRLYQKMGYMNISDFEAIKKAIRTLLQ